MLANLQLVLSFLFDCMDAIVLQYFAGGILSVAFAVYCVKKVSRLFDIIVR